MSRNTQALIGTLLTAAAMLVGTPAVASQPSAGTAAAVDETAVTPAAATVGNVTVESGTKPIASVPHNYTMSEGATVNLACQEYWVELTQYTTLGFTHWKWRHTVDACYDGVVVTVWRNRYDALTYSDGTAYAGSQIANAASALPTTPASSFIQRRIDICIAYYGCYWSYNPWSRININGNGTWYYNWAIV